MRWLRKESSLNNCGSTGTVSVLTESVTVEVKLVKNCDIVDLCATNGADLCVNQGDTLKEC